MDQRSFGRRTAPRPEIPRGPAPVPPKRRQPGAPETAAASPSVEDEIAAWKRGRIRRPFPWRQLSLVAGLSFGIASFLLPDTVNNAVQWVLYGLAAAGFFAGLRYRRRVRRDQTQTP